MSISIHASAKEATATQFTVVAKADNFNPRLREGGDRLSRVRYAIHDYFNPRLREGGDCDCRHSRPGRRISIHASAKEATVTAAEMLQQVNISIHASAKEATPIGRPTASVSDFNPRLREGGDRMSSAYTSYQRLFQSTPPRRRRRTIISRKINN